MLTVAQFEESQRKGGVRVESRVTHIFILLSATKCQKVIFLPELSSTEQNFGPLLTKNWLHDGLVYSGGGIEPGREACVCVGGVSSHA